MSFGEKLSEETAENDLTFAPEGFAKLHQHALCTTIQA